MIQRRANRAMDLRHATQTVSILHAWIADEMRLPDLTILQQLSQVCRDCELARMWTRRVNTLVECDGRAFQSFECHRARDVSHSNEPLRTMKRKRTDCTHRLRAV